MCLISSSLSTPVTPDGFEAQVVFDQSQPLNAFNLWKSTLAAMYKLAQQHWETQLGRNPWIMAVSDSNVRFIVAPGMPGINLGHIAIAIYNAVNAMFRLQPGFFRCYVRLVLHGRQIGRLVISTMPSPVSHGAGLASTVNSTAVATVVVSGVDLEVLNATSNKNGGNNKNRPMLTRTETDADDPRLRVDFEYQNEIARQDLWTAVLDGMITAMEFDSSAHCRYVTAVSVNGNLVFHLDSLANSLFDYRTAVKVFRLMALISMDTRAYRELEMDIFYDGTKVAEGYVLAMRKVARMGGSENVLGRESISPV